MALTTIGGIPGSDMGVVTEPGGDCCWSCCGNDWYVEMGENTLARGGAGC